MASMIPMSFSVRIWSYWIADSAVRSVSSSINEGIGCAGSQIWRISSMMLSVLKCSAATLMLM